MRWIKEITINIPEVNQKFELGDLTIFIGRPNSGKTRILQNIVEKMTEANNILRTYKNHPIQLNQMYANLGIDPIILSETIIKLISSQRQMVQNTGQINSFTSGFQKINDSSKKMDPTIKEIGNREISQKGKNQPLSNQGSGIKNILEIFAESSTSNFLLIDEPEVSQFPSGKIEVLKHVLNSLEDKQILIATHDPTFLNQYIIKKYLADKNYKIVIYSFCNEKFSKIDFESNLNPEIHCGYLSQTLSGKPIHLIFEGATEFYAFQALMPKYCLEEKKDKIAERVNKIGLSFLGGSQWKVNIHHVPDPKLYEVLVILDGDKKKELDSYLSLLPIETNKINLIKEFSKDKINLMLLKANDIEKAFEGIYLNEGLGKPLGLSEKIWKDDREVMKLLKETSEESKQIYEILEWALNIKE